VGSLVHTLRVILEAFREIASDKVRLETDFEIFKKLFDSYIFQDSRNLSKITITQKRKIAAINNISSILEIDELNCKKISNYNQLGREKIKIPIGYYVKDYATIVQNKDSLLVGRMFETIIKNNHLNYLKNDIINIGIPFDYENIKSILTNGIYCGHYFQNGRIFYTAELLEPVVSKIKFNEVQLFFKHSSTTIEKEITNNLFLFPLTGFVTNSQTLGSLKCNIRGYYEGHEFINEKELHHLFIKYIQRKFYLMDGKELKFIKECFKVFEVFFPDLLKDYCNLAKVISKAKPDLIEKYSTIENLDFSTIKKRVDSLLQNFNILSKEHLFVEYWFNIIKNADRIWEHVSYNEKRNLQLLLFPFGLSFDFNRMEFNGLTLIGT
jgi:hypothetical protein